ncbi:MAG: hypothetical protein ACLUE8_03840 [Lachnospiraceae bacterium]
MRKRVVLALLLVAAMVVTSSCSLIVKDAEVDAQTPIITVVGQTFTKGEVNALVQNSLNYQASLYSTYGLTFLTRPPKAPFPPRRKALSMA